MKKLERTLTLPSVIAIAIGGMLGSGIFVLPGIAAAKTGPSIWMAYLLAGFCVLPAALSKAELSTAMPTSGGTYIYIERAFGPLFGTIAGFGLWLSLLLKSSFALMGFGAYLMVLANVPIKIVAMVMLGIIMGLNLMGVKKVGVVQMIVVSLSLLGMMILVVMGMIQLEPELLEPSFTHGTSGLLAATGFVFVSYAGVTKIAAIAEEIKDPNRNLPLAMLLALGLIASIYGLVVFVMAGNLPIEEFGVDPRPIYSLAKKLAGNWAGIAAAILGIFTLSSMANSGVLAASRFPFAMSRDNLLPPALKMVHPRFLTPVFCILLTCALMATVIIFLDLEKIAKLASAFKVMMFLAVNGSVIILRETAVRWYKPGYYSPFYPYIQIFGIVSGIGLLIVMGILAVASSLTIIAVGFLVYMVYGRKKSTRRGVLNLYGGRAKSLIKARNSIRDMIANSSPEMQNQLDKEAKVVVPIFGQERSPEMLVELASAMAPEEQVEVVHLLEVPSQTDLEAMMEDDLEVLALKRRLDNISVERSYLDVEFDTVATHELIETVQAISERAHCDWLVIGWNSRASQGLFIRNPIGWLISHLSCNVALFKDNGIKYIRNILVYVEPSPHEKMLVGVADRLARVYDGALTFVRVMPTETSQERVQNELDFLEKISADLMHPVEKKVLLKDDPDKAIVEASAGFDLVVTWAPRYERKFLRFVRGVGRDKLAKEAYCSVLRLYSPSDQDAG